MPRSSPEGKETLRWWIIDTELKHKRILDIGVGQGTYVKMYREVLPPATWVGIDIWEPYRTQYKLDTIYDEFYLEDVRTFDYQSAGPFDIIFAGDILEHMKKEEAVALVDRMLQSTKDLYVSIPIIYLPQKADHGNPYEEHIKPDWSHKEFTDTFPQVKKSYAGKLIGVYHLTGN